MIPSYLFIIAMSLAEVPLLILAWHLYNKAQMDSKFPIDVLGKVVFYITISKIIFYTCQIIAVVLGLLGLSYAARTPIILLVDGSLFLVTFVNWYAYFLIKGIINRM